jgi:hypothetical protein
MQKFADIDNAPEKPLYRHTMAPDTGHPLATDYRNAYRAGAEPG